MSTGPLGLPRQHPLVTRLGAPPPGQVTALPPAAGIPELVTLVGFVDGTIVSPATGHDWVLVYRDWRMITWWLVEGAGIYHLDTLPEDGRDTDFACDVVWVGRDAAIGRGSGPQSDEARFLTGQFTRAGDVDRGEFGGASSAETGLFCANTPLCNCGKRSR